MVPGKRDVARFVFEMSIWDGMFEDKNICKRNYLARHNIVQMTQLQAGILLTGIISKHIKLWRAK